SDPLDDREWHTLRANRRPAPALRRRSRGAAGAGYHRIRGAGGFSGEERAVARPRVARGRPPPAYRGRGHGRLPGAGKRAHWYLIRTPLPPPRGFHLAPRIGPCAQPSLYPASLTPRLLYLGL